MERVTISLDDELAADFDAFVAERGYSSRSEAIRDVLRTHLTAEHERRHAHGHCVAAVSFVYNHRARDLAERLAELQHAHHDMVLSSMRAPLDHANSLESVFLQGPIDRVRELARALEVEKGVRHTQLNIISVESGSQHAHGGASHGHLTPKY